MPFTERWENFDLAIDRGVATVTFARPEKLNALTFEVYADLRDLVAELPHRGDVAVLVITGTGRGFCSGGDVDAIIGQLQGADRRELLEFTRMTGTVVQGLRELPLPVIVCGQRCGRRRRGRDSSRRRHQDPGPIRQVPLPIHQGWPRRGGHGVRLPPPPLVGLGRATELLLLGEPVDSATAVEIGLANRVVDDGDLSTESAELAGRLASGPTLAHATTKLLLTRELDMSLNGAIELEAFAQALLMSSDDHAEFFRAFTAKREPKWTGK